MNKIDIIDISKINEIATNFFSKKWGFLHNKNNGDLYYYADNELRSFSFDTMATFKACESQVINLFQKKYKDYEYYRSLFDYLATLIPNK